MFTAAADVQHRSERCNISYTVCTELLELCVRTLSLPSVTSFVTLADVLCADSVYILHVQQVPLLELFFAVLRTAAD